MAERDSIPADPWDRVRQRLTSSNVLVVREVRRLIDLPQTTIDAEIAPLLASNDVERLRLFFTVFGNISQNLLVRGAGRPGHNSARQQTATYIANRLGDRIKSLGHPTKTSTPARHAKRNAYGKLVPLQRGFDRLDLSLQHG
jgi:hypothetical protein